MILHGDIYEGIFEKGHLVQGNKTLPGGHLLQGTFEEGYLVRGWANSQYFTTPLVIQKLQDFVHVLFSAPLDFFTMRK